MKYSTDHTGGIGSLLALVLVFEGLFLCQESCFQLDNVWDDDQVDPNSLFRLTTSQCLGLIRSGTHPHVITLVKNPPFSGEPRCHRR